MANEFKVKNGLIVVGDLTTSGTITINGALAATQSWVTSQAYLTSASLSGYATQSYVTSAIAALVDSAPAALDTLNELAAALGDDANFATTITTSIGNKVSKSGDTMTGDLTLNYGYPRINFYDSNHDSDYALINNDGGFSLYDITNNVHRWWVSPSGNMGIGTTSPVAELHVNGSGNTGYLHLTNSTSGSTINDGMTVGVNASNYFVFVREAAPLYFGTDSTERMRITSAGNVGIGTTAPTAKLEVASSGRILGIFRASSTPLTTFYDNTFATGNDSGGANGFIYTSGTGGSFPLDYYGELILQSSPRTGYNNGISLVTGTTSPSVKLRVAENGNVGIGTNSPSSKLQVAGDIRIQNETGLITDYGPLVGRYNTSQVYVGTGGSYSIVKIGRADGGALNVLSGGNVGIGTDSPATKLHVAGNAWINRPSNKVDNASCTELPSRVEFNNAFASGQSGYMIFRYPTYNNFLISGDYDGNIGGAIPNIQFGRQSTVYMHINSSNGNIGIGTTSPGAKLHVGGGEIRVDAGQAVTLDTSNSMYLVGASNQLRLYNGGNPVVNITTGGNVGIGLTSPAVKLHVAGTSETSVRVSDSGGSYMELYQQSTDSYILASNALRFYNGGSERMRITNSGNVGIGTTSPESKLHVAGGDVLISNGQYYSAESTTGGNYKLAAITSGNVVAVGAIDYTSAGTIFAGGDSSSFTTGGIGGATRMYINSSGNIGIGTTSPSTLLTVNGNMRLVTGTTQGLFAYDAASGGSFIWSITRYTDSDANDLNINALAGLAIKTGASSQTYTGHQVYINSSGKVGIGTRLPVGQLNVFGGTGNSPAILTLQSQSGGSGLTGIYFRPYQNETFSNSAEAQAAILAHDASYSAHLKFLTKTPGSGTNTLAERMRLSNVGNLGIGTTTPTAPVDAFGVRIGRNFSITDRATVRLDSNTSAYPADILFGHTSAANQSSWDGVYWSLSSRAANDSNNFYIYRGGGNPGGSGESVVMALQPNGNVGVGTTTPAEKLDVNGNINATGYKVNGVAGYNGIVTIQQAPPMPNITIEIQNGIIVNVL